MNGKGTDMGTDQEFVVSSVCDRGQEFESRSLFWRLVWNLALGIVGNFCDEWCSIDSNETAKDLEATVGVPLQFLRSLSVSKLQGEHFNYFRSKAEACSKCKQEGVLRGSRTPMAPGILDLSLWAVNGLPERRNNFGREDFCSTSRS